VPAADEHEQERGAESDSCREQRPADPRRRVADGRDGEGDRTGRDLPERDGVQELPARQPVVVGHGVVLHQRDDHEAAAVRECAGLEGDPGECRQAAHGNRDGGDEWEQRERPPGPPGICCDLQEAAGGEDEDEPRADHRGGATSENCVREPAQLRARPAATRGDEREAGLDGDGRDARAGARGGAADPERRRVREEERGEGDDRDEPGKDERRAPEETADAAAKPPGAVDRELRRRGAGQEVAGGDRILELRRREPAALLHAELAQKRYVRGRASEPDRADPAPPGNDDRERGRSLRLVHKPIFQHGPPVTSGAMGEEQRLSAEEQLATAREAFEHGTDFTVAVEEEFALLDPDTLLLVNRFEDLQAAARGTDLEHDLVGELIASEAEVRTGKCADFTAAAAAMTERRGQLQALARDHGLLLGSTGTHPWARWQDQRIINTPHYRRNDELLRYVVWRNNTFGLHVHVGIRGADRAVAVCNALRNLLPELLALSASSPFLEDVNTGLHSARTEIFTRMFPRCGIPDAYDGWQGFEEYVAFLYQTGSISEHTQLWWSVRPHLGYPTVEIRICDGQPDLAESQSLAALIHALAARCARAFDEGEPLPNLPNRLLEENLWRALRYGLPGELIDFERGEAVPARARIGQLIEWVAPVADEIGAAPFLALPAANAAERQLARLAEGATLREIYAEQVAAGERIG
jgi:glutamate---cysteine ligase / carboxylate-amine ligase